ncbi:MAG TPA: copper resistance protein CopC [Jatrophihabitans sp.]|jgi:copper transport protein|uniref:copper resistance CopC/CopD family protein n=1 Tax=Jatrophihabitans sp. TaxID=1932789 RepID=UPI002E08AD36|nr:copper resistance protein CopC [Jatrophihabitans sp.]
MRGRLVFAVAVIVAAQVGLASTAAAHAVLVSSNPSDGQVLASAPAAVNLGFSEAVDPSATRLELVDARGRHLVVGGVRASRTTHVVAILPRLPDQTYRLTWQTVSADDRHQTSGVLVFRVGTGAAPSFSEPRDRWPSIREATLRWLELILTGGLVGGLVLSALAARPASRPTGSAELRGRVLGLAAVSGALAAVAAPLLAVDRAGGPTRLWSLMDTPFGRRSAAVEGAILALVAIALAGRRRRVTRTGIGAAAAALGVLAVATAELGHGATSVPRTLLEASHLLAAYLWFGVVLLLPAVTLVGTRHPGRRARLRRELPSLLVSFGAVAGPAVGWLIVSGLLLTGDSASTVDALATSVFGRLLFVKLALAGIAGLLGLRMRRRVRSVDPRVTPRGLAAEAAVLLAALAAVGALVSSAPAQGLRWQPGTVLTGSTEVAGEQSGLVESLVITPNVAGRDFVEVHVFNSRRPAPSAVSGVRIALSGPAGERFVAPATRTAEGAWSTPVGVIDRAGRWSVRVQVERSGSAPVTATYAWRVAGHVGGPARELISTARVAPIMGGLAGGAAVLAVGAGLLGLARARRRAGAAASSAGRAPTGADRRSLVSHGH